MDVCFTWNKKRAFWWSNVYLYCGRLYFGFR